MIPYAKHEIDTSDIESVMEALSRPFLTQGPVTQEFEESFSRYVQSESAVAVNSGTAALHLACLALEVSPGDVVWTSPISFVASANCALYCGAKVGFFDIDKKSGLADVALLKKRLQVARESGRLPKVVIVVHYGGLSCDMIEIQKLSMEYGFSVIEDACHALGGSYNGAPIGSCKYSDISTFSFHPAKNITTCEGGMLTSSNESLIEHVKRLRTHGITRDSNFLPSHLSKPWYYQQLELGFNFRMPDLLAALGISQLKRLDQFVARRREISQEYDYLLAGLPLSPVHKGCYGTSGCHLYVVRLDDWLASRRDDVMDFLRNKGIGVNLHYLPLYLQPYYYDRIGRNDKCLNAEEFSKRIITLPLYTSLSKSEIDIVVAGLKEAVEDVSQE